MVLVAASWGELGGEEDEEGAVQDGGPQLDVAFLVEVCYVVAWWGPHVVRLLWSMERMMFFPRSSWWGLIVVWLSTMGDDD